jgi:hypothetical protein
LFFGPDYFRCSKAIELYISVFLLAHLHLVVIECSSKRHQAGICEKGQSHLVGGSIEITPNRISRLAAAASVFVTRRIYAMKKLIFIGLTAALAACQSGPSNRSGQPAIRADADSQTIQINASPETVRNTLVDSASARGTIVQQNEPNMVVMESYLRGENAVFDNEFGPSDAGERAYRIRVRFSGSQCSTNVVQDIALVNNIYTPEERAFQVPSNSASMQNLQRLKANAESSAGC